ncbi:glycosyltransferase [Oscillatoria salina]|uniref:glycosyltransferase n=1 Tax=Oscillatoria salina TaxID=331517 RepID=UPI001CCCF6CA|nr:glycosyltransferase [Oscillatoria salina]MBZ8179072.1 glycosyltransferase [Oscillatoria salina IIICB1]
MKKLPSVSVIVPIYNGEKDLPDLVSCLLAQTYPAEQVEYLLVDNNSSDRTADLLQAAAEDAANRGLTIRSLTEKEIQSSYAARNTGIKAAISEILAFTDADCRPIPDWLQLLVEPFANSEVGLVVGEIVGLPGTTLLEKYAEQKSVLSQKFTLEHPFCPYGQTANLAIRREAFTEVGLFRPYMITGGDADICWRILQSTDWKLEFAAKAIIRHRHRSNLRELRSQWRRYGKSNRYLHELYGVDLMREATNKEIIYRLGRWLLKELPVASFGAIAKKNSWLDAIATPIDLIGFYSRSLGQKETQLPELAKKIDRLSNQ